MYIVITGTSRGIGFNLTKLALAKGHHVLAVARVVEESEELMNLKVKYKNLDTLSLDLTSPDAHLSIQSKVSPWPMVDAVINNAGILLEQETIKDFEKTFFVNSIMPFFITKALISKLNISNRPVSLQISSQMGSIEDNSSGGSSSYRASKAALNMLFKGFSLDEKKIISLLVHPGWVQTRMGGSGATLSVEDSAHAIWKIFEEASLSQSGLFLNYDGTRLPW